ncbi:MAG TPA: carboxypeptidase-like regulatory domain-containing protein [Chroococcales cyanobacterium]|jgi:hypothetical protein
MPYPLASLLALAFALGGCVEPSGPGTLAGTAVSSLDGKPYVNAKIQAIGSTAGEAMTDARGEYRFEGIASGLYQVRASMGKKNQSGSIKVLPSQIVRLNFRF